MAGRVYLVAGERSGDAHAAELVRRLRRHDASLVFRGCGGPELRHAAGESILDWVEEGGVVGVWEVLGKYGYFRKRMAETVREIEQWNPDVVVLIDYPGFNLRLARRLHRLRGGWRLVYYISPQVWAWNRARIPRMAVWLDCMLCIFPFEKELYEASGLATEFVGHPLVDKLAGEAGEEVEREEGLVGFFPGSRRREIEKHLPVLLECVRLMASREPSLRFVFSAASESLAATMREALGVAGVGSDVGVVVGDSHKLMRRCGVGVVASGTATLEAAFFGMPYALVYKVALPTYWLARLVVKVPYLGIVNILAGRELVAEFVQSRLRAGPLADHLLELVRDGERRAELVRGLQGVVDALGKGGAAENAARAILARMKDDGIVSPTR